MSEMAKRVAASMGSPPPVAVPAIDLGTAWAGVSRDVLRGLLVRQVPRADAEDIVQEVAARALTHAPGFATTQDLVRWSWRVAWRLRIDALRREARLDHGECPDVAGADDSARIVEGRLALGAALDGITRLSPADRHALFATAGPGATRQAAVRVAVRRHRARARLIRLCGGALGAGAWFLAVLRRLRPEVRLVAGAALPLALIVALDLAPFVSGGAGEVPAPTPSPVRWTSVPGASQRADGADAARHAERPGQSPVPAAPEGGNARTIAAVPVGEAGDLRVDRDDRTDPPSLCVGNVGPITELCVDRPGPSLDPPPPFD